MPQLYEFLVRWNDAGEFQGAHVVYAEPYTTPSGETRIEVQPPVSVFGEELLAVLPGLNLTALNRVTQLESQSSNPAPPADENQPDWTIAEHLRCTPIFAKAFAAASESTQANAALSLLLNSLLSHTLADLRFAFNTLRLAMAATDIGDFTAEDLSFLSDLLTQHNFPLEDFNVD